MRRCTPTHPTHPALQDELTEYKWCVLAWNGIFHTWSTLWLLWWLPQRRWYWNTEFLWENILAEKPQKMELEFKAFYMLQLGYHLQSIGWHFVEERRPDFATMMVHHVVTVMLIVGSYVSHFSRIGMLVLLVHDSSDIFVCITKCFHMCGWKKPAHVCFGLMVLAWAYTRLYLYPFWVIGSTWTYPEVRAPLFVCVSKTPRQSTLPMTTNKQTNNPPPTFTVSPVRLDVVHLRRDDGGSAVPARLVVPPVHQDGDGHRQARQRRRHHREQGCGGREGPRRSLLDEGASGGGVCGDRDEGRVSERGIEHEAAYKKK